MPFADDLLEQAHHLAAREEAETCRKNFAWWPQLSFNSSSIGMWLIYDNAKDWSRTDVENVLALATDAFEAWPKN